MSNTVEMDTLARLLQDDAVTAPQTPEAEETLETAPEETVDNTRADAAPPEQGTAKDFSVALNKRMEKERAKLEAEISEKFRAELDFATEMRKLRGGKDYRDIIQDTFDSTVKTFAQNNGVPEGIARELLALKMAGANSPAMPVQQPQNPVQNPRVAVLADQVDEIKSADGIDMMEVLQANEGIREKVGKGEWDINRAYAHYLSSERKRTPPVSRTTTSSNTAINYSNISKAEFDKIDARLKLGEKLKIT